MAEWNTHPARGSRKGLSIVEVLLASTVVIVILMGAMTTVYQESKALRDRASTVASERQAQNALARIENELQFAQGMTPTAWLAENSGAADSSLAVAVIGAVKKPTENGVVTCQVGPSLPTGSPGRRMKRSCR